MTCTSVHSRNWRTGNMLGKGMTLDEALDQMGMAVEGVRTTEAVAELAVQAGVDMPITEGINQVLPRCKSEGYRGSAYDTFTEA